MKLLLKMMMAGILLAGMVKAQYPYVTVLNPEPPVAGQTVTIYFDFGLFDSLYGNPNQPLTSTNITIGTTPGWNSTTLLIKRIPGQDYGMIQWTVPAGTTSMVGFLGDDAPDPIDTPWEEYIANWLFSTPVE